MKTTVLTYRHHFSLALITFGKWRHSRLLITSQLPDNCDASTEKVISNSIDINFTRGNVHGRPWKKEKCFPFVLLLVTIIVVGASYEKKKWYRISNKRCKSLHDNLNGTLWHAKVFISCGGNLPSIMGELDVDVNSLPSNVVSFIINCYGGKASGTRQVLIL